MAVILAYGSPALGHLFPLAALLRELAARGHQVYLRTMSAGVAKARAVGINAERSIRGSRTSSRRTGWREIHWTC